eukprot:195859-Chlamydomonas_euryale.AAC.1
MAGAGQSPLVSGHQPGLVQDDDDESFTRQKKKGFSLGWSKATAYYALLVRKYWAIRERTPQIRNASGHPFYEI